MDPRPQPLDGSQIASGGGLEPRHQLAPVAIDVRHVQTLLGAEVGVQHRLRDVRQGGDLVHRGGVVALAREHDACHVEDQLLALSARHPACSGPSRLLGG